MFETEKKWVIGSPDPDQSLALSKALGISPVVAKILSLRGITEPNSAASFLNAPLKDILDPFLMKGMRESVERIIKAIRDEEKVLIFGDYDVDGVTAASLFVHFFREIGYPVDYYIPNRLKEGYGLSLEAIENIRKKGVNLLITADCGIGSVSEVKRAVELGMDVIITDHHQVPQTLPPAYSILNPLQKNCVYPYKSLSGAGIIYKLLIGLRTELRKTSYAEKLPNLKRHLDLVALATIADLVPLTGENHILAKHGLEELSGTAKPGLRALKSVSQLSEKVIDTYSVGFLLAPRLNAAGRLGEAEKSVKLLTSEDMVESLKLATGLDEENRNRQQIQEDVIREAKEMIKKNVNLKTEYTIVLESENWHPGVIGIAASKIVDMYHRPTILIALKNGTGKGSGRSIEPFNIYEGLKECSKLLSEFGGHEAAAGLALKQENISVFKSKFAMVASERLKPDDLIPTVRADDEINLDDMDIELIRQIESLAPFGMGNRRPAFVARNVQPFGDLIRMGKNKDHIKFEIRNKNGVRMEAVGFFMEKVFRKIDFKNCLLDILFTPQINAWKGRETIQLKLADCRVHPNQ